MPPAGDSARRAAAGAAVKAAARGRVTAAAAPASTAATAGVWTPLQQVYRKTLHAAMQLDEKSVNPARRALLRGMPSVVWSDELQRKVGIQQCDNSYYRLFSSFNQGELFKPVGQSAVAHVKAAWRDPNGNINTAFEALKGLRLILEAAQKLPKCTSRSARRGLRLGRIPRTSSLSKSRTGRLIVGHPLASVLNPDQHRGMMIVLPKINPPKARRGCGVMLDTTQGGDANGENNAENRGGANGKQRRGNGGNTAGDDAADDERIRGIMIHRPTDRTLKQIVSGTWGERTFGAELLKQKVWWGGRDKYGLTVIHTWSDVPDCKKILPGLYFSDLHQHFLRDDYAPVNSLREKVRNLPAGETPRLRFVVNNTTWKASELEASLVNNWWLPLEEDRDLHNMETAKEVESPRRGGKKAAQRDAAAASTTAARGGKKKSGPNGLSARASSSASASASARASSPSSKFTGSKSRSRRSPLTIISLCFDKKAARNASHNGPWKLALSSAGAETAILTAIPDLSSSFGDSYKRVYEAHRKKLQETVRQIIEREKQKAREAARNP